jgi:hypothetical protein
MAKGQGFPCTNLMKRAARSARSLSKEEIACIIEVTHGLLITHLLEAGWAISPPLFSSDFLSCSQVALKKA